jgi:DNA-binding CsgD family transcriptional regulator
MQGAFTFEIDSTNRVTKWSDEGRSSFGREAREVLGRSWVSLLKARDVYGNQLCPTSCGLHATARAGEPIGVFEIYATLAGGESLRLFVRAEAAGEGGRQRLLLTLWPDRRRGSAERRRGAASDRAQGTDESPLSPRETEVLRLLSRGQRVEEVAARLGISATTVRNHAQRLLGKLGARSRAEAVTLALRRGLL